MGLDAAQALTSPRHLALPQCGGGAPGASWAMAKKFPIKPANPERICWGCDKYCPADSLQCGNGSVATPHPSELFGDDWLDWGLDAAKKTAADEPPA
jgi:hypothetical protein